MLPRYTKIMNTYIIDDIKILISQETGDIVSEKVVNELRQKNLITSPLVDKVFNISTSKFLGEENIPEKCEFIPLREYFYTHTAEQATRSARAKALLEWRDSVVFCAKCGTKLVEDENLTALNCPSCKTQYFPRIEPAVIVLVSRGNDYLLVRHKLRIQNIWACVAGFVEIGESLEHAVVREVREEVGIEIKDIRYCTSQGWPFPNQLMLGFRAEYASGEIKLQQDELSEAKWFPKDALPEIPKRGTLGYKLISGEFN